MRKRVDIKSILNDDKLREELMVRSIIAIQSREGIETTEEQALDAYLNVKMVP